MKLKLQLLPRLISSPDFLINLSCVCILIDYFIPGHKLKHNSLTGEIIYAKKLLISVNSLFLHTCRYLIFRIEEYFS